MRAAILSPARWSSFRLSKHYVALALAERGHDVLYVDPPLSAASALRQRERVADMKAPADEVISDRLRLWRPRVLPGQNSGVGQQINARLLRRGILRRLGDPDLVVAFSLESRGVFRRLGGRRVYYCTDSFEDLPGARPDDVRQWEQQLVDAADVVVACSLPLCAQLQSRGADPVYLPHGCDDDWFAVPGPVPEELRTLPRPIVGYVGSLNFRIDVELLEAARRGAGDGTLLVVGGAFGPALSDEARALLASPGVVAIGHRSNDILQDYVAALDVGVVPYSAAAFNRKSFPIKVLQYLAAGTPVVSSPNGATDELANAVAVAGDPTTFESAVRAAIGEPGGADERRAVASQRRWSGVVDRLLASVMS